LRKAQYQSVAALIRDLSRRIGVDFRFERHAEEEMRADGVSRLDVQNALRNCSVVKEQDHDPFVRYLVAGPDTDGRRISVVIEIEQERLTIHVVTVWK
jgi:hypothetical protein